MAWTAQVKLRGDSADVGLVTCIWNEGQADEFTYSRLAKVTTKEKARIVTEAKAAQEQFSTKVARESALSGLMATALNA